MKERIRLVFSMYDSSANPYFGGGGASATHNLAKRLAKKYDVKIICGSFPGSKNKIIDGVRYQHIGISTTHNILNQLVFNIAVVKEVMRRDNYDIWFENFCPPFTTNLLPLFTNKPVIGVATLLNAQQFSEKYKLPFYLIEKYGLKLYNHIVLLSSGFIRIVRRNNKSAHIYVIPRGIEGKYLRVKPKYESFVLYIGRIDIFQKGLDILVRSWKNLATNNNIKLVIAGDGPRLEKERIRNLISENCLDDKVNLIGKVQGKQKQELLKSALFGVIPSRFEGFGNSALDFMSFGKTIVIFNIPGFEWIKEGLAIKVSPYNEVQFAKAIKFLTSNRQKTISLGRASRKFARKFGWEGIVDKYDLIIKNLI